MCLEVPQNNAIFFLVIFISIHLISPTTGYHVIKKDIEMPLHGIEGGSSATEKNYEKDKINYQSQNYEDFGHKDFKHVMVKRDSAHPSLLRSWCSLLPDSPTRYVPIRCKIAGDFPIDENECQAYHHCQK